MGTDGAVRGKLCLYKFSRVVTELDNSQTEYWLDLLHETKFLDDKMYESIHSDCVELVKMLTAAIKKLKEELVTCPLSYFEIEMLYL